MNTRHDTTLSWDDLCDDTQTQTYCISPSSTNPRLGELQRPLLPNNEHRSESAPFPATSSAASLQQEKKSAPLPHSYSSAPISKSDEPRNSKDVEMTPLINAPKEKKPVPTPAPAIDTVPVTPQKKVDDKKCIPPDQPLSPLPQPYSPPAARSATEKQDIKEDKKSTPSPAQQKEQITMIEYKDEWYEVQKHASFTHHVIADELRIREKHLQAFLLAHKEDIEIRQKLALEIAERVETDSSFWIESPEAFKKVLRDVMLLNIMKRIPSNDPLKIAALEKDIKTAYESKEIFEIYIRHTKKLGEESIKILCNLRGYHCYIYQRTDKGLEKKGEYHPTKKESTRSIYILGTSNRFDFNFLHRKIIKPDALNNAYQFYLEDKASRPNEAKVNMDHPSLHRYYQAVIGNMEDVVIACSSINSKMLNNDTVNQWDLLQLFLQKAGEAIPMAGVIATIAANVVKFWNSREKQKIVTAINEFFVGKSKAFDFIQEIADGLVNKYQNEIVKLWESKQDVSQLANRHCGKILDAIVRKENLHHFKDRGTLAILLQHVAEIEPEQHDFPVWLKKEVSAFAKNYKNDANKTFVQKLHSLANEASTDVFVFRCMQTIIDEYKNKYKQEFKAELSTENDYIRFADALTGASMWIHGYTTHRISLFILARYYEEIAIEWCKTKSQTVLQRDLDCMRMSFKYIRKKYSKEECISKWTALGHSVSYFFKRKPRIPDFNKLHENTLILLDEKEQRAYHCCHTLFILLKETFNNYPAYKYPHKTNHGKNIEFLLEKSEEHVAQARKIITFLGNDNDNEANQLRNHFPDKNIFQLCLNKMLADIQLELTAAISETCNIKPTEIKDHHVKKFVEKLQQTRKQNYFRTLLVIQSAATHWEYARDLIETPCYFDDGTDYVASTRTPHYIHDDKLYLLNITGPEDLNLRNLNSITRRDCKHTG